VLAKEYHVKARYQVRANPLLSTTIPIPAGEQRAFTVLLFGSSLAADEGGETHFPELGVSVWPRAGDAIAWSNVHEDGSPNPRSLHEGRPPKDKV